MRTLNFVTRVELIVLAFKSQELVVTALFNDASVVKHDDAIGISHSREAMCYDKGGSPFHERVHTLLHHSLGSCID